MPRWMQFAMFLSIVLLVYGGTHYYTYRRVLRLAGTPSGGWLWAARGLLLLLIFSYPLARFLLSWERNAVTEAFHFLAAVWMGFFLYLLLLNLAAQIGLAGWRIAGLPGLAGGRLSPAAGRALLAVIGATALAVSIWGCRIATAPAEIARLELKTPKLPARLDGFRIVQFTDVHIGDPVGAGKLQQIVGQINQLDPDLVVFTGDLADIGEKELAPFVDILSGLHSRYGTLAVTGNHEFYVGVEEIERFAAKAGIRYLRNEKILVAGGILVYGVDDPTSARMGGRKIELDEVVGPEAATAPAVLLYHQPLGYERAAGLGVDLMLSGHTHGGQLWPFSYISRLIYKRQKGKYKLGEAGLHYVSRGAGTWGPPMRVGAPPEIVEIILKAGG